MCSGFLLLTKGKSVGTRVSKKKKEKKALQRNKVNPKRVLLMSGNFSPHKDKIDTNNGASPAPIMARAIVACMHKCIVGEKVRIKDSLTTADGSECAS